MHVLVTAGAEKQSLAAVRSLGAAGVRVDVLDTQPGAPAFDSRYCDRSFVAPSNRDAEASLEFLLSRAMATRYTTILACDDRSATLLSEERREFEPHTTLLLPSQDDFRCATDKTALVRFAAGLGIPVPRTFFPASPSDLEPMARELGFPVIVKGGHGWGAQHVRLVRSASELLPAFESVADLESQIGGGLPMLQEFVSGTGYGLTVLFRHGEARALFMHRRTAEFDVQDGGKPYSCPMAVSLDDPELRRLGLHLFEALRWHGLGMAEWRRETATGRFVLMEINPRLVGSTDLALRAGVDLPLLACRMARDGDVEPVLTYRSGVRMRWVLPDGLRDLLARPARLFDPGVWSTATDWSWRDPAPHWRQLRLAAWAIRHGH